MAVPSLYPLLQLPTVTQEDLSAFHARVFGSAAPAPLLHTEPEIHSSDAYKQASDGNDDDLGYYPDGAKRTLTDDQIAMFRHSEIYSILRERQVRKENLEAEGDDQDETMVSQPEDAVEATALFNDDGEGQFDGEAQEVFATVPETTPQHVEATQARKKRKRGDTDTGYVHGRKYASRSARGFVRELDSAAAEDQVLDYGDEPAVTEEAKPNGFAATKVAEQGRESQARPSEGRKIWWPIIEAT